MATDIAVGDARPTATLELRQAQPLGDGRHFAAFLVVRAGAFAAALPFVFTREAAQEFCVAAESLTAGAGGAGGAQARLAEREGGGFIAVSYPDHEALVSGELHEPEHEGLMRFAFATSRDAASQLVAGMRALLLSPTNPAS